jgi:hypothetical protein
LLPLSLMLIVKLMRRLAFFSGLTVALFLMVESHTR